VLGRLKRWVLNMLARKIPEKVGMEGIQPKRRHWRWHWRGRRSKGRGEEQEAILEGRLQNDLDALAANDIEQH
jgi:hypothetical protein